MQAWRTEYSFEPFEPFEPLEPFEPFEPSSLGTPFWLARQRRRNVNPATVASARTATRGVDAYLIENNSDCRGEITSGGASSASHFTHYFSAITGTHPAHPLASVAGHSAATALASVAQDTSRDSGSRVCKK